MINNPWKINQTWGFARFPWIWRRAPPSPWPASASPPPSWPAWSQLSSSPSRTAPALSRGSFNKNQIYEKVNIKLCKNTNYKIDKFFLYIILCQFSFAIWEDTNLKETVVERSSVYFVLVSNSALFAFSRLALKKKTFDWQEFGRNTVHWNCKMLQRISNTYLKIDENFQLWFFRSWYS